MQHQRGNHATGYTSNEMFVLKVAQHGQNTSGPRWTTTRLYCRHFTRVKLLVVRYRSVSGKSSCILYNASNIRLHSAAYLLIRGRQCRCVCGNARHSRNRFFGLIRSSVSLSPFNWLCNAKGRNAHRTQTNDWLGDYSRWMLCAPPPSTFNYLFPTCAIFLIKRKQKLLSREIQCKL